MSQQRSQCEAVLKSRSCAGGALPIYAVSTVKATVKRCCVWLIDGISFNALLCTENK